jgi:hypothetical protein
MNLLQDIADKINSINADPRSLGIKSVLTHIEIAETHFAQARRGKIPHLYTDVVYRTNHAFEGILKEAYQILENKPSNEKTPSEIENYLSNSNVFNQRVMELFVNYRKNWRNPSTHDHKLFFLEQEAFLAIVTVSAFVNLLLDQIIEKVSYDTEKAEFESRAKEIAKTIKNYENLHVVDKIAAILFRFAEQLRINLNITSIKSDSQLLGMLAGFLSSIEPNAKFDTEPTYPAGTNILRPTGLVRLNNENIVVTILHTKRDSTYELHGIENIEVEAMKSFLSANNYNNGIVFYLPQQLDDMMVLAQTSGKTSNSTQNIREIYADEKSNWIHAEDYYTSDKDEDESPAE